jgi:hypothetical protein
VPPCERRNAKLSSSSSKSEAPGDNTTYLKLEKPCFLFLEASGGAPTAPVAANAVLADASAACAASSTDRPAAGASAPAVGACSSAASVALGDGGGGFHLSEGATPRLECDRVTPPRSAPADRRSRARSGRTSSPSTESRAAGLAPRLAGAEPLRLAVVHEDEASSG